MKVLFTPLTGSSIAHIVRSFAVADELKARGHDIYFTSCDFRKDFIEKNGYKVVASYETINLNDKSDQSVNYLVKYRNKFINWFATEIKATQNIKPDIVVNAPGIFGPHTFYSTRIPVVSILDSQYLDESKGLMGLSLSTDKLHHKIITSVIRPLFDRMFIKLYLNEILSIYEYLNIKHNIKTRKDMYSPMGIIIPSDEEFQPLRVNRENTIHIGPLFWDGFEKMDTDLTDERISEFKDGKNLVYITFGGSIFDKNIYDIVIKGLEKAKDKIIVALGPNLSRDLFPPDNEDMIIRDLVPGMRLSKHADLIINTGSQGAVMQGLYFGKPQISFPTTMDQSFFANRLEEKGIGINVNKISILNFAKRENFSSFSKNIGNKIVKAVDTILNNPKYVKNARQYMQKLVTYEYPAKKAADFIENFVKK